MILIALVLLCVIGTLVQAQGFLSDPLDLAIREASNYLNGKIANGTKTVFLNITSNYPDLSEYILSLLSENAVNDKNFSVVDRKQLESIREELSFQMSGEVDDSSAQSIGKMLGAQSIVSGSVSKIGPLYRLEVKAIEVQTAAIKGQWSKNFPGGSPTIAALTETQSVPVNVSSSTTTSTTQNAPVTSNNSVQQVLRQISEEDLIGVWRGSYGAGQGETALILTVYKEGNRYMATFDFYNLPGRSNAREGKYNMEVSYNVGREKFYLKGVRWIEQPSGYVFVDLEGTINGN